MAEEKYAIIREQGEFMNAVELSDEENACVNNASEDEESDE